jgi:hypothetical protein
MNIADHTSEAFLRHIKFLGHAATTAPIELSAVNAKSALQNGSSKLVLESYSTQAQGKV